MGNEDSQATTSDGLVFSDVGIYTTKPVGLHTMRVNVRGTVRNASDKPVDGSTLPRLECDGVGYPADIGTQQFGPGESRDFTYEVNCRVDEDH